MDGAAQRKQRCDMGGGAPNHRQPVRLNSLRLGLRGELTGSRWCVATAPKRDRFAPADLTDRKWFPRRSSADGRPLGTEVGASIRIYAAAAARPGVGRRRERLRARQPGDRAAEHAGAERQPDFGELSGGLHGRSQDVVAACRGRLARSRSVGDSAGLGGLRQPAGSRLRAGVRLWRCLGLGLRRRGAGFEPRCARLRDLRCCGSRPLDSRPLGCRPLGCRPLGCRPLGSRPCVCRLRDARIRFRVV